PARRRASTGSRHHGEAPLRTRAAPASIARPAPGTRRGCPMSRSAASPGAGRPPPPGAHAVRADERRAPPSSGKAGLLRSRARNAPVIALSGARPAARRETPGGASPPPDPDPRLACAPRVRTLSAMPTLPSGLASPTVLLLLLAGCASQGSADRYLLERVDDTAIAQLYADGFAELSPQDRVLCYHLAEAAIAGRDIFLDQRFAYNLELR